ncbi:alpha/beta fold hydrolase [Jeotgalibacillus proteolyticus]|uniref:Alpha/beta hydrolase n=1 Tax=Jeotgalibacillus proteolyticus TaxID=2082395 RepID=A0A2S5GDR9_9BACL|nr:alpha/beta hydrolase [Jeotgalibacillus proteolyticus]PPA71054.1 alpha/beta hydrolase [Jeotgalibacillus proteolyticus]
MERTISLYSFEEGEMEYSVIGKGVPVLVFHGGHSNCHEEFGYEALLQNGYSIITPSRPGYGKTYKKLGTSLAEACGYYAKLLDHLQIEKVHVLGISAGGPSGIYFSAAYPQRVHSLTLQSAVTKEWLTVKDMEYKAATILFNPKTERLTWKLLASMNNAFPRFLFKQMFSSFSTLSYGEEKDKFTTEDLESFRKMNNRQRSGHGFFIDLKQVNELSVAELQTISAPTFIMHSKYDSSVPLEHASYAHQHIPKAELCHLEAWGHLIWLGNTKMQTDEHLLSFLSTHQINN